MSKTGDVELSNMQLKPEALNALKLPVKVKAGFLGSVKLKVCGCISSANWSDAEVVHLKFGPFHSVHTIIFGNQQLSVSRITLNSIHTCLALT